VSNMTTQLSTKLERISLLERKQYHESGRVIDYLFTEEGATSPTGEWFYPRSGYPKHLEFFAAGAKYRERCFMAANRVGKTLGGAYEMALHLTGQYPDWWTGRRFDTPISAWAAGKTNETTRDTVQAALLGKVGHGDGKKGFTGTGTVRRDCLGGVTWRSGVADLADKVRVKHVSGGWSELGFKAYHQGRGSFEGTALHVIWTDEEVPIDVYGECLIRTATTNGILLLTFTPLAGLTETVLEFLPGMKPGGQ
jgi:phage terminase large subunit-like protein